MSIIKKDNAAYFLFINAALWGSTYVWSKILLSYIPHFWVLFINSLGSLIITFIIFHSKFGSVNLMNVLRSIAVSILSVISNTFFIFALQYTSSANTAFIVQTSVVITPLIMGLIEKKIPERKVIISAPAAVLGIFLLTFDFNGFKPGLGDLLALGNALFFSISLIAQKYNSKNVNPMQFTLIYNITNTVMFLVLALTMGGKYLDFTRIQNPMFVILILANICVAMFTVLIQSTAIRFVKPEKVTIIYTLEPVIATLLGFIFMKERIEGVASVIGGIIILLSVVYSVSGPADI